MEEWKEYKARDFCSAVTDGTHDSPKPTTEGHYLITSKHLKNNRIDFTSANLISEEDYQKVIIRSAVEQYDILFSMIGTIGNTVQVKQSHVDFAVKNMGIFKMGKNSLRSTWLYYWLNSNSSKEYINQRLAGSTQSYLTLDSLRTFPVLYPGDNAAQSIVSILKSLDDKIEVNRRINDNLEQQARALFKSWFVDFEPFKDGEFVESELGMIPKGWRVESLSSIADYINGLAMQKYRPEEVEKGLPVLKIKELGQGSVDENSELCSPSLIGEKYIINDGDIIFSWSGTLMVKVWCGGKCGLNQHLFVVVPKDYQKWFVYQWTKYHLDNFIRIAKDKAVTMGHIKRGELDKAKVIIPDSDNLTRIDALMDPIFNQIISNEIESRRLATLRDALLPKLMSGELKVNEIKE